MAKSQTRKQRTKKARRGGALSEDKEVKKLIDEAHKKLQKAKKDELYVRTNGRPGKLEDIQTYAQFDILYVGKHPEDSYYLEFEEDEGENEYHRPFSFYHIYDRPPFHFFLDWLVIPHSQHRLLGDYTGYGVGDTRNPMAYLMQIPSFAAAYEGTQQKAVSTKAIAAQKFKHLQEKALEQMLAAYKERTGTPISEDVEAHLRSMMTKRHLVRNYNATLQNFGSIQTNLFTE